jgi:steroid 5-alpha reductase family enzyme
LLQLLLGLVAVLIFFTILWGLSLRLQNTSVAETGWGLGVLVIGLTYYFTGAGYPLRAQLTLVLLAIWAFRLAAHLGLRMRLEGEDYRHVKWREEFEEQWWYVSYVRVFLMQAVLAWAVSLPVYFSIVSLRPPSLTLFDYLGVLMFLIGLGFETVGDEQLRRFRGDRANKGKVLDAGLWRYTRHPNYFGEVLLWWGFGFIGLATGGVPGLLGPAIFTYMLIYVSGMMPLESTLIGKVGYAEYVGRTPGFLPISPQVRLKVIQVIKSKLNPAPPPKPKRRY